MSEEDKGRMVVAHARSLVGCVVSDKMLKTVTVVVGRRVRHDVYGKIMTRSKKYHARNDSHTISVGDVVEITECRPFSKTVSWRVSRLVSKAKVL